MDIVTTRPCVVAGCITPGICLDDKCYTKQSLDPTLEFKEGVEENPKRELWYCQEHATEYLFPAIDFACRYTAENIVQDYKNDGMWG